MLNKGSILTLEELLQALIAVYGAYLLNWEQFVSSVYTNGDGVLSTECNKFYTASQRA